jgi:hypothetical protein
MDIRFSLLLGVVLAATTTMLVAADAPVVPSAESPNNPWEIQAYPRVVVGNDLRKRWEFKNSAAGWRNLQRCRLKSGDEYLAVVVKGSDPYFGVPDLLTDGVTQMRMRLRSRGTGGGQMFWGTEHEPDLSEDRSSRFDLIHDNEWHEYEVKLRVEGVMTLLRFDPGIDVGEVDLAWIELRREVFHPVEHRWIENENGKVTSRIVNHSTHEVTLLLDGVPWTVGPRETEEIDASSTASQPFGVVCVRMTDIQSAGVDLPDIERCTCAQRSAVAGERWLRFDGKSTRVDVDPKGLGARLYWKGDFIGSFQPLVGRRGLVSFSNGHFMTLQQKCRALVDAINNDPCCQALGYKVLPGDDHCDMGPDGCFCVLGSQDCPWFVVTDTLCPSGQLVMGVSNDPNVLDQQHQGPLPDYEAEHIQTLWGDPTPGGNPNGDEPGATVTLEGEATGEPVVSGNGLGGARSNSHLRLTLSVGNFGDDFDFNVISDVLLATKAGDSAEDLVQIAAILIESDLVIRKLRGKVEARGKTLTSPTSVRAPRTALRQASLPEGTSDSPSPPMTMVSPLVRMSDPPALLTEIRAIVPLRPPRLVARNNPATWTGVVPTSATKSRS